MVGWDPARQRGFRRGRLVRYVVAVAACLPLVACSGSNPDSGGPVTLKLATFGDFGYTEDLIKKFEDAHPNVKVETSVAASSDDARTNLITKLAAGSGLADVEAVEISWVAELRQYAKAFVPVTGDRYGDWIGYQKSQVTLDGDKMFGYGVATGPEAVCFRSDLLKRAGVPDDPAAVARSVGSWEGFFAAGEEYVAGGGKAWFDSAYIIFNARVAQLEFPYEDAQDNIVAASNPEVERIFRDTLTRAPKLSAKLEPFSEDWAQATANGGFAVMACPSWMLGIIQGNASNVDSWRIADAFPGGGGNVGGSFLVVPTQSKHPKEASELASWLTAPEQQIAAFKKAGPFPSRVDALDQPDLTSYKNAYFGDAEVGKIFANRTKAISTLMHTGPHFRQIDAAAYGAVVRVETGKQSVDDAWKQFVTEVQAIK